MKDEFQKYPRSMQEAFGPYVDHDLQEKENTDPPMSWQDELVLWSCAITILAVVLLVLGGVL